MYFNINLPGNERKVLEKKKRTSQFESHIESDHDDVAHFGNGVYSATNKVDESNNN